MPRHQQVKRNNNRTTTKKSAKMANNNENKANNNNSETTEEAPRRGRKKGSKSGFRPIYFIGAVENEDGGIELKEVVFTNEDLSPSEDDPTQPAIPANDEIVAKFEEEHGTPPLNELMAGPFNRRNVPSGPKTRRPRLKANLPQEEVVFTGKKSKGQLAGWNVSVHHLKNKEFGYVFFLDEIEPGEKKRQPPAAKPVKLSDIENLESV